MKPSGRFGEFLSQLYIGLFSFQAKEFPETLAPNQLPPFEEGFGVLLEMPPRVLISICRSP